MEAGGSFTDATELIDGLGEQLSTALETSDLGAEKTLAVLSAVSKTLVRFVGREAAKANVWVSPLGSAREVLRAGSALVGRWAQVTDDLTVRTWPRTLGWKAGPFNDPAVAQAKERCDTALRLRTAYAQASELAVGIGGADGGDGGGGGAGDAESEAALAVAFAPFAALVDVTNATDL